MNNHRLLTGLMFSAFVSSGVYCAARTETEITLEDIFASAESNSTQLRPLYTAESEAEHEIRVARSQRLPDLTTTLSLSYIGDGFTTKRNLSDYQSAPIPHFGTGLGIQVSQPVYTGGAITEGIRLAELKLTAARYAAELEQDNIRFRLTGFYLDIYKYTNLRKVVEVNIAQAQQVLDDMKARYEEGTVLRNDITRYELLVENLNLQLIRINNTMRILNDNLVITAGLPADMVVLPDTTILDRSLPCVSEEWWQESASQNSPRLRLARNGVEISRRAESLVRSERLPKIALQAGWTIDGPILVEVPPINRNLNYWWIGVGVSYNLGSLWKTNKSLTKSRITIQRTIEELAAAEESVELATRADYIRYLEAYENLKTLQKSVELADRNYTTVSTRYAAEMALITDMLDAANAKLDAEQQLVNARIQIIYYYYKLLFISGTI